MQQFFKRFIILKQIIIKERKEMPIRTSWLLNYKCYLKVRKPEYPEENLHLQILIEVQG